MRKIQVLTAGLMVIGFVSLFLVPFAYSQEDSEKKFMKQHQEEMTAFMNKCSACHSLQRIFATKRSAEEWDKILKRMSGKPQATISAEEVKRIQKWIELMQATLTVSP